MPECFALTKSRTLGTYSIPGSKADYKCRVTDSFGQAASTYNHYATVQQECAEDLIAILRSWHPQIPAGPILEIGCGTGLITQKLIHHFPDRPLEITDISESMLEICQRNVPVAPDRVPSLSFRQMDGENLIEATNYAAIVSGFVVQWFEHPVESLQKIIATLKPGGILLVSFPTQDSFPEWKQICQQIGLPFTANALPDPEFLSAQLSQGSVNCTWHRKNVQTTYSQAIEFFKSLKLIGAGLSRSQQRLSAQQMRQLIRYWNQRNPDGINVQYHIAFLVVQHHREHPSFATARSTLTLNPSP